MSFIIKGLDFPETCGECPCCVEYDEGACVYYEDYHTGMYCSAQDSTPDVYDIHQKLSDCPLVEIPTPHGRLIDADELYEPMERDLYAGIGCDPTSIAAITISEAPTIIEAEVSE